MSAPDVNRQKEDWSFYYALYHMLAHWTAYLTILVLLLTVGVLWSTSQNFRNTIPTSSVRFLVRAPRLHSLIADVLLLPNSHNFSSTVLNLLSTTEKISRMNRLLKSVLIS